MKIAILISPLLLGMGFIIFGLNILHPFMTSPPPPEGSLAANSRRGLTLNLFSARRSRTSMTSSSALIQSTQPPPPALVNKYSVGG
jgi:hypothetical protein